MMLEGHRVDNFDGRVGRRASTEEQTGDGLVGVFESMYDEFGVGKVIEAKVWGGHAPIAVRVRIRRGSVPARRNRPARSLALSHFHWHPALWALLLSLRFLVPISCDH